MAISTTTTFSWNVTNLMHYPSNGLIILAQGSLTGIATGPGGVVYKETKDYSVGFSTDGISPDINYNGVTETKVLEWVKEKIGISTITQYQNELKGKIDTRENQGLDSGDLPWS